MPPPSGTPTSPTVDLRTLRSWLAQQQTSGPPARRWPGGRPRPGCSPPGCPDRPVSGGPGRGPRLAEGPPDAAARPPPRRGPAAARRGRGAGGRRRAGRAPRPRGARAAVRHRIRVGELCGLDVDDVDHERRVVRVLGKGRKERVVPYGLPAAAGARRLAAGPAARARPPGLRAALFLGARGGAHRPARRAHARARPARRGAGCARPRAARAAAHRGDPPARGWRGPAQRAGAARPRVARRRRRSTPTSPRSGCARPTCRRTRAPDRRRSVDGSHRRRYTRDPRLSLHPGARSRRPASGRRPRGRQRVHLRRTAETPPPGSGARRTAGRSRTGRGAPTSDSGSR